MFKLVIVKFVSDEIDNWFFVSVEIETMHNARTTVNTTFHLSSSNDNRAATISKMKLTRARAHGHDGHFAIAAAMVDAVCKMSRLSVYTKQLNLKLFKARRCILFFALALATTRERKL